ncbi:hypothetical protein M4D79_20665 [Mycolicibacterium novocastrense]|nr:hypothetical protein M4D79_20665 [Mycolicibacterium novocastrense]
MSVIDINPSSPTYHRVIDANPATTELDPIPVASVPQGISVTPGTQGARAYVVNSNLNTVTVIDIDPNSPTYNRVVDTDDIANGVNNIAVGGTPYRIVISPDGTRAYVMRLSGDDVAVIDIEPGSPTYNRLTDADPDTPAIDTYPVGDSPDGIAITPDGTRLYVTSADDGTITVINLPAATHQTDVTSVALPGILPSGTVVTGADGTSYVLGTNYDLATGQYTTAYVMVFDPADPANPTTITLPGNNPVGTVVTGADATAYQTSNDYDPATGQYTTYVTVIDPADPANPTTITLPGKNPVGTMVTGADGTAYQTSAGNDPATGQNTYQVTVIDPADLGDPTTITLPGNPYYSLVTGADGTAYQISEGNDPATNQYTAYVTVIDPANPADPTTITLPGNNLYGSVVTAADGTAYQTSAGNDPVTGQYTAYVTVIDPANPANPTTITLPGNNLYGSVVTAADGTAYQTSAGNDPATNQYTAYVTVIDPANPANPTTITLPGNNLYGSVVTAADGTAYQTSRDYDSATGQYTTAYVTVIDPANPANPTTITLPGNNPTGTVATGADGTAYQTSAGYDHAAGHYTAAYLTVIDPADPANPTTITLPGNNLYGSVATGADGTAYQTSNDYDSASGPVHRLLRDGHRPRRPGQPHHHHPARQQLVWLGGHRCRRYRLPHRRRLRSRRRPLHRRLRDGHRPRRPGQPHHHHSAGQQHPRLGGRRRRRYRLPNQRRLRLRHRPVHHRLRDGHRPRQPGQPHHHHPARQHPGDRGGQRCRRHRLPNQHRIRLHHRPIHRLCDDHQHRSASSRVDPVNAFHRTAPLRNMPPMASKDHGK